MTQKRDFHYNGKNFIYFLFSFSNEKLRKLEKKGSQDRFRSLSKNKTLVELKYNAAFVKRPNDSFNSDGDMVIRSNAGRSRGNPIR